MLECKFKVILSTVPIALLGALLVLMVQPAPLPALAQPTQGTFFEEAVGSANATEAGPGAEAASAATGPRGEAAATGPRAATQEGSEQRGGGGGGTAAAAAAALLRQGQISSSVSDVPGREDTQSAIIVPPRDDNAVLSGILTYQASRPVSLFVWNNVELENTTAIPEEFGSLDDIVNIDNKTFALADVSSGASGSVPFTGNAIEVVGEDDPFIVTYSLNAIPALANLVNNLQSLNSLNATAEEEGE
jgi:hypothetical protein